MTSFWKTNAYLEPNKFTFTVHVTLLKKKKATFPSHSRDSGGYVSRTASCDFRSTPVLLRTVRSVRQKISPFRSSQCRSSTTPTTIPFSDGFIWEGRIVFRAGTYFLAQSGLQRCRWCHSFADSFLLTSPYLVRTLLWPVILLASLYFLCFLSLLSLPP